MSQGFNGRTTNDGRPNIHPLQSGMGILTPPPSGSTSSSYRFTSVISASPPGTSTSGSSDQDQNQRELADSDFQAKVELTVSGMEEKIRRMETKIRSLYNLNQREKEGREALQRKCQGLEAAVRDREGEVAALKHRIEESEKDKERVMQELGMQNMRHRTEDDITTLFHVAEERTENNHDLYQRSGYHVQARTGPSQASPPQVERNTYPGSSMRPPLRQQTAPNFIGGFA